MFECCLEGSLPSFGCLRNALLHCVSPVGVPPTSVQKPVGRARRNFAFGGVGCYSLAGGLVGISLCRMTYFMGLPLVSCQRLAKSSALFVLSFCACMGRRRSTAPALGPPIGVISKGGALRSVPPSSHGRCLVLSCGARNRCMPVCVCAGGSPALQWSPHVHVWTMRMRTPCTCVDLFCRSLSPRSVRCAA